MDSLCRRIRGTSRLSETPILIFSALGKGVKTMLGNGEKADEYLDKSFDKKDLLETVGRACLDTRRGERRRRRGKGSGIGLTLVKYLVERYRGSISIHDRVPGRQGEGVTVSITFMADA